MSDLRYGLRLLRRQPGFAAVAILTMALGIGATTVLFSVASGVLFGAVGPIDISAVPELQAITAEVRPAILVLLTAVVLLLTRQRRTTTFTFVCRLHSRIRSLSLATTT